MSDPEYPSDRLVLADTFAFARRLSAAGRALLEAETQWHEVEPMTKLVCRGDAVGGVYLVTSGAIRVYYLHPEGREGTLYFVDPGDACFLSVNAVMDDQPYAAWAETDTEPVRFAAIPPACFRRLFEGEPALQQFTFSVLSRRVAELMQLVEATAACGLEARLAAWLLSRADAQGLVRGSQDRIARHVGTSREVVVRVLRGLRARGFIETERNALRILNHAGLAALV